MNCTTAVERLCSEGAGSDAELQAHLATCASCAQLARASEWVDDALVQLRATKPRTPPFEEVAPHARLAARSRRLRARARRSAPLVFAVCGAVVTTILVGRAMQPAAPPIAVGDALSADASVRTAQLPDGARMRLQSGHVALDASGGSETLMLSSGSVALKVPKLAPGHSLMVQTSDALVTVHGTQFTVSLAHGGTKVEVTEGLVEVRPTGSGRDAFFLHPGDSALVEPLTGYQKRTHDAAVAALDSGDTARAERALDLLLATKPEGEASGEAHALLAWVRRAEGQKTAALDLYRQSLTELPAGSQPEWAEDACAERAMIEQQAGQGVAGWRDCLRRFPDGAHADLARRRLGILR